MAARSPSAPGADYLDDAAERLRAMKTALGLVLARALTSIGSRFLVLGSAIAVIDARTAELEKRDNISWPALKQRLDESDSGLTDVIRRQAADHDSIGANAERFEKRATAYEQGQVAAGEWRLGMVEALAKMDKRLADLETDRAIGGGMHRLASQYSAAQLLHAAAEVIAPRQLPVDTSRKPREGT